MAVTIVLKSFSDLGDRDHVNKAADPSWSIEFINAKLGEEEVSDLSAMGLSMTDSSQAICLDMDGVLREISFSGKRPDGYGGISNADWIESVRSKIHGQQIFKGPYRYIKTSNPTTQVPQDDGSTAPYEVSKLVIAAGASSSGNVGITLDGVLTNIAVTSGWSATQVAAAIRSGTFANHVTGGTGTTVYFLSTQLKNETDATYTPNATGASGTMTTPVQGVVSGAAHKTVYVMISRFRWDYNNEDPQSIDYDCKFTRCIPL